jgi:phage terminase small subunit
VQGKSASTAYIAAGYTASAGNAGRLRNKPEVAARIAELQAEAGAKHEITIESICAELDEQWPWPSPAVWPTPWSMWPR